MVCKECGRQASPDEVGLYKKLVNRGARDAMCITCLAKLFSCTEELLRAKAEEFRRQGCILFAKK